MSMLQRALTALALFVSLPLLAQSADQTVTNVTDSPDPVTPGQTLTYTVDMTNNGPDPATNGGLNVNLPLEVAYQSATGPAGFTCSAFGSNVSCTNPSFAAGANATFTVTVVVNASLVSFPDGSFSANFFPSGTTVDPTPGNNAQSETTNYETPQIDIALTVTDSPDPVAPDGNITYTVPVTNNGPDAATNVNFSVYNNGSLQYQSIIVPSGWSCTPPSVGSAPIFGCTTPSLASGATSIFTVVVKADDAVIGINDTTVQTNFSAGGTGNETNNANNSETETTAYVAPDADMSVSVTDAPDPVAADNDITYTVQVANGGPDAATNATLGIYNNGSLQYRSITVPSGWSCTPPAVNAAPIFNCTNPSFASGGSSTFTLVVHASSTVIGINDTTVQTNFSVSSGVADPDGTDNSETETTAYITPDADLSVTASDSPDPVTPDNDITYTVQVANGGPDAATNATLSIYNNGTLQYQSITVPSGWSCTPPAVGSAPVFSCTNPSFANGGSSTFTLVVRADFDTIGNADTTVQTNFSVSSSVADPDGTDDSETETTAYDVANANLGVTASDAPDPVAGGNDITYTGTITNAGPDAASNATLTIVLASNLLFESLSGPAGFSCTTPAVGANGTITCTIATLANAASLPFTLVARVDPAVLTGPDGVISQTFMIGSVTNDPTPSNDTATVTTQYTTPDADLTVTNADSPDPVAPGGTITYTQTVTNNGPDAAANVVVTQGTPAGTTFQSLTVAGWSCTTPSIGGTGAIQCTKASMANGETATFTLVVNVTASSGTIVDTVSADADTYDPDSTDNAASASTTVDTPASADLSITKTTAATNAPAGSTIGYTIAVSNAGPDAASSVVMTDTLPASLLFQSITRPSGFTCTTPAVGMSGTITCSAASLANGATRTFTLVVRVAANATSGSAINSATVDSATSDPDSGDTSGNAFAVALAPASADLSIIKSTTSSTAAVGSLITYTITVSNAGPSDATNVVVDDTLPAELEFVSADPSQGSCDSSVQCTLGTIVSGGEATITLRARVIGNAGGTIENSATVSATEGDPNGGDNDSTAPAVSITAQQSVDIPTLSEWALLALAAMLGLVAIVKART